MTHFDKLPLEDVIHELLFPMLDYDSRIQFNQILMPYERHSKRLVKKDILQHEILVQTRLIRSQMNIIGDRHYTKLIRCQRLCSLLNNFRFGKRGRILVEYLPQLRDAVIVKFNEFLNPNGDTIQSASPYFKKKIRALANELMPEIRLIEPKKEVLALKAISVA